MQTIDPPHHYIKEITPALWGGAAWWTFALARCNGFTADERSRVAKILHAAFETKWRRGCDKDMCLWEEDMPPVLVTATPDPGSFLLGCMELIAAELGRDIIWKNRAMVEMTMGVERVWLRIDGKETIIWSPAKRRI